MAQTLDKLVVEVIAEFKPSEEFDKLARVFGYTMERTCRIIDTSDPESLYHNFICSECRGDMSRYQGKYCPHCGAKVVR